MEIFRHTFCAFDLDEQASLLSFNWTEKLRGCYSVNKAILDISHRDTRRGALNSEIAGKASVPQVRF